MKSITIFSAAILFTLVSCISNTALANDSTAVLPKQHSEPAQPAKTTSCNELNKFVGQCFTFYNTTKNLRLQMEAIFGNLSNMKASEVDDLLVQLKASGKNIADLLPQLENMATTAPDLFAKAKKDLSVFEYPRALANIAVAAKTVKLSIEDLKFMITTTIPSIKALLASKKTGNTDSSSELPQQ